ncbi:MAG TPA: hypothetical protein VM432_09020 [Bdellovibrionales bacterium]|nr:hypothetical protein [Bdellovibrionales bacterium]
MLQEIVFATLLFPIYALAIGPAQGTRPQSDVAKICGETTYQKFNVLKEYYLCTSTIEKKNGLETCGQIAPLIEKLKYSISGAAIGGSASLGTKMWISQHELAWARKSVAGMDEDAIRLTISSPQKRARLLRHWAAETAGISPQEVTQRLNARMDELNGIIKAGGSPKAVADAEKSLATLQRITSLKGGEAVATENLLYQYIKNKSLVGMHSIAADKVEAFAGPLYREISSAKGFKKLPALNRGVSLHSALISVIKEDPLRANIRAPRMVALARSPMKSVAVGLAGGLVVDAVVAMNPVPKRLCEANEGLETIATMPDPMPTTAIVKNGVGIVGQSITCGQIDAVYKSVGFDDLPPKPTCTRRPNGWIEAKMTVKRPKLNFCGTDKPYVTKTEDIQVTEVFKADGSPVTTELSLKDSRGAWKKADTGGPAYGNPGSNFYAQMLPWRDFASLECGPQPSQSDSTAPVKKPNAVW